MLSRGFLFAAVSFSLVAQAPDDHYRALREALGLSDSQMWQLQQKSPAEIASTRPESTGLRRAFPNGMIVGNPPQRPFPHEQDPSKYGLLDDVQKAKLQDVVEKVWRHPPTARLAIAIELTSAYQWPRYPCPAELRGLPASDLDLTDSQLLQLQDLRQSSGASTVPEISFKEYRRTMLLNSGRADSPEVVQLTSDISTLREKAARRRELTLAVLDDAQKAKLAAFDAALQILSEARELRLIPCLGCGEALCQ